MVYPYNAMDSWVYCVEKTISLTCFCMSATASIKYLVLIFGLSSGFTLSPNVAKEVSAYFASSSSDTVLVTGVRKELIFDGSRFNHGFRSLLSGKKYSS